VLLVEAVKVAVVAHEKKRLGGDLDALRTALADRGVTDPIWYQVPKSKKASKKAKQAVGSGAEVLLVWGGDGTVRRCLDAVAGSGVPIGILPAGSANLLAANLGIREDLEAALETALHGSVRVLDVGVLNDERFAVMAGAGFDAVMVRDADDRKDQLGRFAYLLSGIKALRTDRVRTTIDVDGDRWFEGRTSCVLVGNVGVASGGLVVFPDAHPDDGELEIGVVTADGPWEWARVFVGLIRRRAARSSLVRTTRGRDFDVRFDRGLPYEVDGGDRDSANRLRIHIEPSAVAFRVP
jgi:diacylglycerol kinase family enzyme